MTTKFDFISSPDQISGDFFLKLHQLDQDFFPTPWSEVAFKSFIESHQFLLISLSFNHEIIGFALFEIQDADSFAHLLKILIKKEFQGKKYGDLLLKEALNQLKILGMKKYFLEVESTNLSAIKIYLNAGFKKVHLNKNFYGPNRHADIMTFEVE